MDARRSMLTAFFVLGAAGAGAVAHQAQLAADQVRASQRWEEDRVFLPDPSAVKIAALGFDQLAASMLWVRSVLVFSDVFHDNEPGVVPWLGTMLRTVHTLDPGWRTLYEYGGGMLRLLGDVDGSDEFYTYGKEAWPELSYFPFAIAMNAYLYRKDPERAFSFMKEAAGCPDAPEWYGMAAASFLDKHGQRGTALRYLTEQIEAETDAQAKEKLEQKYREVLQEELASRLEDRRARLREARGQDIRGPEELGELPEDPRGGRWIIGADGLIRSSVVEDELRARAATQEKAMLRGLWDKAEPLRAL